MAGWEAAYRQRVQREIEAENAVSLAAFEQQVRQNEQQRINRTRDVKEFCEAMVQRVIIRPGERDEFIALAEALAGYEATIQFGEGEDKGQSSAWDLFKRLIEHRPPLVMLGEFCPGGSPSDAVNLAMPEGVRVDDGSAAVHNAAVAYQQKNSCSYRDAVRAVTGYRK